MALKCAKLHSTPRWRQRGNRQRPSLSAPGTLFSKIIQFENALRINGQVVPAGKYSFFTIPGREEWTVILNENYDQHQADEYDQALDLLRLPVKLVEHVFTEQLTYYVSAYPEGGGVVEMMWEELKISMPLEELE